MYEIFLIFVLEATFSFLNVILGSLWKKVLYQEVWCLFQTQFHSWSGLNLVGFILDIFGWLCEELEGGSRNKNLGVVKKSWKKDRLHLLQNLFQLKVKNRSSSMGPITTLKKKKKKYLLEGGSSYESLQDQAASKNNGWNISRGYSTIHCAQFFGKYAA